MQCLLTLTSHLQRIINDYQPLPLRIPARDPTLADLASQESSGGLTQNGAHTAAGLAAAGDLQSAALSAAGRAQLAARVDLAAVAACVMACADATQLHMDKSEAVQQAAYNLQPLPRSPLCGQLVQGSFSR